MINTDCSNCPTCVIERASAVLRAANVQVCGVAARREGWRGGVVGAPFTFGLREDAPVEGAVAEALTQLAAAYIGTVPIRIGRPITAENDHDILTIEITSRNKTRTYYKICYHVKTPPVAAG